MERVALANSQRDAHALPAGATRLDFEPGPEDIALHFYILPGISREVRISVYHGDKRVAVPIATDDTAWSWRRVPIEGDAVVSLALDSKTPFYLASCALAGAQTQQPDVLVYLIDTLRQDHLGCYHYPLDTSPHIDLFSEDAALFFSLIPMSSWTRPSVASLLTGTMDYTHHALSAEDHLRDGLPSLAKTLEYAGWTTHGIVANSLITAEYGFGADFQWYETVLPETGTLGEPDKEVVDRALTALSRTEGQPLFLYLHLIAPHREYSPPPEYKDLFMPDFFVGNHAQARVMRDMALYDAEIRFSDDQFARVIRALKESGRYDNTLIVLLSDHGEQFMEHGKLAHAQSLHFAEIDIPFLVKLPGNPHAGRQIRHTVQMADVAPTILAALSLTAPAQMEGRSLLPLITHEGLFPPAPAFARLRFQDRHYYMAQTETLKYIHDVVDGKGAWFDIFNDPFEFEPLRNPPEGGRELKAYADEQAARPIPERGAGAPPLTESQIERLEALGYL